MSKKRTTNAASGLKRLGLHVRSLRSRQGMTQKMLAERSGLDVRYVSRLELGYVNPTFLTLERIMNSLAVCPAALPLESHDGIVPHDLCACIQSMMFKKQKAKMRKALECFDSILDVKPLPRDMLGICSIPPAPGRQKAMR